MSDHRLAIGQIVRAHRESLGLSQEVLAGLVGRTPDWLSKIETGRIPLDRLSVIERLAAALKTPVSSLLPAQSTTNSPSEISAGSSSQLSALVRTVLIGSEASGDGSAENPHGPQLLRRGALEVWSDATEARYARAFASARLLIPEIGRLLAITTRPSESEQLHATLAILYSALENILPKQGEQRVALIAAERAQNHARQSGSREVELGAARSAAHALLSNGYLDEAMAIVEGVESQLAGPQFRLDPQTMRAAGGVLLVGVTLASRGQDHRGAARLLRTAERLGSETEKIPGDPSVALSSDNVRIHRVVSAAEFHQFTLARDLSEGLSVAALPRERQLRHLLEVARICLMTGDFERSIRIAGSVRNRAPDYFERHFLSRQIVEFVMTSPKIRKDERIIRLARSAHVV